MYVVSRENYPKWMMEQKELLSCAQTIHLIVLAPYAFYDPRYSLGWFGRAIDNGLKAFIAERQLPYQMDFKFKQFPGSFNMSLQATDEQITKAVSEIKEVLW